MSMIEAVKCFKVAKKVTKVGKAEATLRTSEVYGLLSKAYSRQQIIQECSSWGVSDRQVDTYISHARKQLEEDCDMSRKQLLAEMLQRLRGYEQAAARRGQYQVAVNSATQQAKLVGLDTA